MGIGLLLLGALGIPLPAHAGDQATAGSALVQLSSTDNAAVPQAVPAGGGENEIHLGDLPLSNRSDVVLAAVESLPGNALNGAGVRLRGGGTSDVAIFVDGFRLYHLRPPLALVQRVDVLAAGYGVSLGDLSDGAIFTTSPPMTATAQARIELFRQTRDFAPNTDFVDDRSYAAAFVQHSQTSVLSAAASAPLLNNRLFVTASIGRTTAAADGNNDPDHFLSSAPAGTKSDTTGALALTSRPSARHQINGLALLSVTASANGDVFGVAKEAQPSREARGWLAGLRWTASLTDRLILKLQASSEAHHSSTEPRFCRDQPDRCDAVSPMINTIPTYVVFDNGLDRAREDDSRMDFAASLDLRLGGASRLQQHLRGLARLQSDEFASGRATPSGRIFTYAGTNGGGPIPGALTTTDVGAGSDATALWTSSSSRSLRFVAAVEDEIDLWRRLWIRPGIGLVSARISGAQDFVVVSDVAPIASLSVGWNVNGQGRTWLRGAANRRVDPTADGASPLASSTRGTLTCEWKPVTMSYDTSCVRQGGPSGQTVGLPCGPSGIDDRGVRCVSPPGMPRTWEFTAGARQALGRTTWIDLDGVYRKTTGLSRFEETNQISVGSESAVGSGFRNGRPETIADLSASENLFRRYVGATVSLGGRVRSLNGLMAYTYSRQTVGLAADGRTLGGASFYETPDLEDNRHGLRFAGRYNVGDIGSLGLVYVHDSGPPIVAQPGATSSDVRGLSGTNPGGDINDPAADRLRRGPPVDRLNLQVRFHLGRWLPFPADLYADVINVLDDHIAFTDGRWTRLGAELRY
jgi:hypothetical protein